MTPIIEVKNLIKTFGKTPAVRGVSFDVYEGEICGLLGPNGAGKTTTIQMLLDLITPTNGTIKIFGKDMKNHREEILGAMNCQFKNMHTTRPMPAQAPDTPVVKMSAGYPKKSQLLMSLACAERAVSQKFKDRSPRM